MIRIQQMVLIIIIICHLVKYLCLTASSVFHPHQPYGASPFSSLVPPSVFWQQVGQRYLLLHLLQLLFASQWKTKLFRATQKNEMPFVKPHNTFILLGCSVCFLMLLYFTIKDFWLYAYRNRWVTAVCYQTMLWIRNLDHFHFCFSPKWWLPLNPI